jgi:rSAM/selenodomain-associated transferase 1
MEQILLIFIRNSILGKVKTRLAADIGPELTLKVYQKLLDHTRQVAEQVNAKRIVCYSDFVDPEDTWGAGTFTKEVQNQVHDLGLRMSHAFEHAFAQSPGAGVVIIGSDCAQLNSAHLKAAYGALYQHDIVIGPAHDGGYYLLGMRAMHQDLFTHMKWSTETVCADTRKRALDLGLTVFDLPMLHDVDNLEDLKTVGWW